MNIGDKVRVAKDLVCPGSFNHVGFTGEVTALADPAQMYRVQVTHHSGVFFSFAEEELEVLSA